MLGLLIGAGLELYKTTKEASCLTDAFKTLSTVINDAELSLNGILKDE